MKKQLLSIGAILGAATVAGAHTPTSNHEVLSFSADGPWSTTTPQQTRVGDQTVIDISGIMTWDAQGDPDNTVLVVDLADALGLPSGTPLVMNGIGWDTDQTAGLPGADASWLSEMGMYFDDNINPDASGLFLRPGAGSNGPGTGQFSSPVQKLDDLTIPNIPLPDGMLRIEFYESFVDTDDTAEGVFNSGSTVTVQTEVIPTPGALALLGLAGIAGRRRRRS